MHFGTSSLLTYSLSYLFRAESAHSKLKIYLGSSLQNFKTSWGKIHTLLYLQHIEIKASVEKNINLVLHNFKSSQFKFLRGVVSIAALNKIVEELKRSNIVDADDITCKYILRKTHGLPCAHELAEYDRVNMPVLLDSIDSHWRKLNM